MLRHEHFEELSAAASAGQVSGAELAELREHLQWCSQCQQRYTDYLALNSAQYAKTLRDEELTCEEAVSSIHSSLLRQRFMRKAAAEGIVFSVPRTEAALPDPRIHLRVNWNWPLVLARVAAGVVLLAAVGLGGYRFGAHKTGEARLQSEHVVGSPEPNERPTVSVAQLQKNNDELRSEISALHRSLELDSLRLSEARNRSSLSEHERREALARIEQRENTVADLQARLDQTQTALSNARADYERLQSAANANMAELADDQLKIRALTDQLAENSAALARERDLLAAGRDVRDLMSARNLHIVDVFDVDPKGKKRPAFGRIFYTEGKSLLFYAYDLPETRLKDAGYKYRIWGKKDGPSQRVHSLGIFFSDDKSQKRWVFQYDDPKVLNEIDSIFVTLEPPNASPNQPKGDRLLYAYLKGPANHP